MAVSGEPLADPGVPEAAPYLLARRRRRGAVSGPRGDASDALRAHDLDVLRTVLARGRAVAREEVLPFGRGEEPAQLEREDREIAHAVARTESGDRARIGQID